MKRLTSFAASTVLILAGCASAPKSGEVSSAIQDSQQMQVEQNLDSNWLQSGLSSGQISKSEWETALELLTPSFDTTDGTVFLYTPSTLKETDGVTVYLTLNLAADQHWTQVNVFSTGGVDRVIEGIQIENSRIEFDGSQCTSYENEDQTGNACAHAMSEAESAKIISNLLNGSVSWAVSLTDGDVESSLKNDEIESWLLVFSANLGLSMGFESPFENLCQRVLGPCEVDDSVDEPSAEVGGSVDQPAATDPGFADSVNLWFEPDFPIQDSSFAEHFRRADYTYAYRKIVPLESANNTYFAILGNSGFPDYYGGIQQLDDGSKAAIFSVWDVNSDGSCSDCQPGTALSENKVFLWTASETTVIEDFGFEGTGMKSMIFGFDWKLGEEVEMLTSLTAMGDGSLISAAIRTERSEWQFIASFYIPTSKESGMPAGFAFVEDWAGSNLIERRSALFGPTYLSDENGAGTFYSKAMARGHNSYTSPGTRHTVSVDGSWIRVETGIAPQERATEEAFTLPLEPRKPDITAGIRVILDGIGK